MKFIPTQLEGVLVIEPDLFKDSRGFFLRLTSSANTAMAGLPGRSFRTIIPAQGAARSGVFTPNGCIRKAS